MTSIGSNTEDSPSQVYESVLGFGRPGPGYTESEALADEEELERLRNQTPSPVRTEVCYDSWDAGEIMMLFKNSGDIKIQDFAYPRYDRRFGGATPPPYHPDDPRYNAAAPTMAILTPPATPQKNRVTATAASDLPNLRPTPQKSRVPATPAAPTLPITPPPTPQSSRVIKPIPRRLTRPLSRAPGSWIALASRKES